MNSSYPLVFSVTSGKGGVGKTNISVNLALTLAARGKRVLLLDADLGLANVDVLLGLHPEKNIFHLFHEGASLRDILLPTEYGFSILPASSGVSEMLALNSKESFERNKDFYRERLSQEELPAVRRLLEQDSKHLDRIQVLMASSREFYIIIRLRGEQESDVFSYLSRIEQNINDNGFTTRRAAEQDLKKMLGVYFEQNVTTEKFEDFDGDRWVIVGE